MMKSSGVGLGRFFVAVILLFCTTAFLNPVSPDNWSNKTIVEYISGYPEEAASFDIAAYLWGDPDKAASVDVAAYLWGDPDKTATTDVAAYLWGDPDKTATSEVAAYLWGDPDKTATTDIAAYLWGDPDKTATTDLAAYLWGDPDKTATTDVAAYLWGDPDKKATTDLAAYLWGDPDKTATTDIAAYLWGDPDKTATTDLAAYLWGDPDKTATTDIAAYLWGDPDKTATSAHKAQPQLDFDHLKVQRGNYIIMGQDFESVRTAVAKAEVKITHDLEVIDAVGAELTLAQRNLLLRNPVISQIILDSGVQIAKKSKKNKKKKAAQGADQLTIAGNIVTWEITNLGNKNLTIESIELSWPEENLTLTSVTINDDEISGSSHAEPETVIDTQVTLKRNEKSTLVFTFEKPAAELPDDYTIVVRFKTGNTLEFANYSNMPLQGKRRDTFYPTLINADQLHLEGITGSGVTVALIDTGAWGHKAIAENTTKEKRILAYYDAIQNRTTLPMDDDNGHGTHLASVIASSNKTKDLDGERTGSYNGVAPDVDLVIVKAFDDQGRGTYMDVIRAISYVIAHKNTYNIRVLNLAFSSTPMSHYWQDPMNRAVMAAWQAGIVVVVSAGNSGPEPMTIGAPGNVPYVITVGAMSDHYTPDDPTDDFLASFSSAGPTAEGFVKPEITAPGGHIMGIMKRDSYIPLEHPEFHDGYMYFLMSGTSQASAVTSGVVALMLQYDPDLTADDVKCRLMASTRAAVNENGELAYSIFQQGTGLINAYDAVYSDANGCVNVSLDLAKDLAGIEHYVGPANMDEDGNYYIEGSDEYIWDEEYLADAGYIWNVAYLSNLGYLWNVAYLWNTGNPENASYLWNTGNPENASYLWNTGNPENASYLWNTGNPENASYLWNTGNPENASYLWNTGNPENTSYLWNTGNPENASYLWNTGNLENASYLWNTSIMDINHWVSQE